MSLRLLWKTLPVTAALLTTVGCAHKYATAPVAPPPPSLIEDSLQESLFKGDQAVLSNQDIDRILSSRVLMTGRTRLAVLSLNSPSFYRSLRSQDVPDSGNFLETLRSAPYLTQVRFLPALLVPDKRTVPYLREAAARFQADLLLVYVTRVETFQRDRILAADEVRAACIVEAVLLDVRTGIVVHSYQTTEGISARKAAADLNFAQTVAKAEADAAGKALMKLAASVSGFMNNAER